MGRLSKSIVSLNLIFSLSFSSKSDPRPLVLVVDDDKGYRDIIQKLLGKLGYNVEVAANGLNALNAFDMSIQSGNKYQAVLMVNESSGECLMF